MSWVRNPLAAPIPSLSSGESSPSPNVSESPIEQVSVVEAGTHPGTARIWAGTSGWAYPTWKPGFYPAGVPAKRFLSYYATQLNSVEVNYTFRALPTAKMLTDWLAATPADFRLSFKAPQRITHFSRLRDCEHTVAQFVGALEPVRDAGKLGLLLFQLPPNLKVDPERLAGFLASPALTGPNAPKIAFEFRHDSWFHDEVYAILRGCGSALCIAETDSLQTPDITCAPGHASFRLRQGGGYAPDELAALVEKIAALAQTTDVYAYFKHEDEPTGALNAVAFLQACRAGSQAR